MATPGRPRRWYARRKLWLLGGVLFVLTLPLSLWLFGPGPPRRIVIATGEKGGMYAAIGAEYARRLESMGMKVRLRPTAGSLENLKLLLDREVDAALVQAGTPAQVADRDANEELCALVAVQWEPVWVFYRQRDGELRHLFELPKYFGRRPRIGIGSTGSGTNVVARELLEANGLGPADADLLPADMAGTRSYLLQDEMDAAFFVSSGHNPMMHELIATKNVRLFSFNRQLAYARRFPYLTPVTLGEGVIDMKTNLPPADVKMFAAPTLIVCRKDLHPQAAEQILIAARSAHGRPDLISGPMNFPAYQGMGLPLHETAATYAHSGESLVARMLPYWGVWLLFKVQILILPLLLFWLPFLRVFPLAYTWRINMLLRTHYAALQRIEEQIARSETPQQARDQIAALDNLRSEMAKVSRKVPVHLQINVYQWRLHVAHVRSEAQERLRRLEQSAAAGDGMPVDDEPQPRLSAEEAAGSQDSSSP